MDATRSWSVEGWRVRCLMEDQWAKPGCRSAVRVVGWGYSRYTDGQLSLHTRCWKLSPASRDLPKRMSALKARFMKRLRRMITPAERKAWGLQ